MARELSLLGAAFIWVAEINPDRDTSGRPIGLMPQDRYAKAETTPLNPNGSGPFCRFTIEGLPRSSGVYAVTVDDDLAYIGKGKNLDERWGPRGYAAIHPRNCFVGGQSTNCKINHRVLIAVQADRQVDVWIHETDRPGVLEGRLIRGLNPSWNSQVPTSTE